MLSEENKVILIKRLKSLAWRVGALVGTVVIAFISANLELLNLPLWAVGFIGLVMGEVTKYLNTKK